MADHNRSEEAKEIFKTKNKPKKPKGGPYID